MKAKLLKEKIEEISYDEVKMHKIFLPDNYINNIYSYLTRKGYSDLEIDNILNDEFNMNLIQKGLNEKILPIKIAKLIYWSGSEPGPENNLDNYIYTIINYLAGQGYNEEEIDTIMNDSQNMDIISRNSEAGADPEELADDLATTYQLSLQDDGIDES